LLDSQKSLWINGFLAVQQQTLMDKGFLRNWSYERPNVL